MLIQLLCDLNNYHSFTDGLGEEKMQNLNNNSLTGKSWTSVISPPIYGAASNCTINASLIVRMIMLLRIMARINLSSQILEYAIPPLLLLLLVTEKKQGSTLSTSYIYHKHYLKANAQSNLDRLLHLTKGGLIQHHLSGKVATV